MAFASATVVLLDVMPIDESMLKLSVVLMDEDAIIAELIVSKVDGNNVADAVSEVDRLVSESIRLLAEMVVEGTIEATMEAVEAERAAGEETDAGAEDEDETEA